MDGETPAVPAPAAGGGGAPDGATPAAGAAGGCASLPRWQRRERAAADALRSFVRDVDESEFGAASAPEGEVEIALRVRVRPAEAWALRFDPPLAGQVLDRLQEIHAERGAYREGAVWCYKCASAACPHARPPAPPSVFAGYDPMGLAEWRDLAQALVEERDERVDQLFAAPPRVLARVQLGQALRARQLGSFGRSSRTYAILGQVVAGHLPLGPPPRREDAAAPRLAATFQVVETRDARGAWCLRLNLLCAPPAGTDWPEFLASERGDWVARARDTARLAIEAIEARVRAARAAADPAAVRRALAQVPAVLHRLAVSLERGHRQDVRRTPHAQRRRHEHRPVHRALEEAARATAADVYRDEKTGHLAVAGRQGRTHVFDADGRLVTSFALRPGGAEFRVRTRRWRLATPEEFAALKTALGAAAGAG